MNGRTAGHEAALASPDPFEKHIVVLMRTSHYLIEDGYIEDVPLRQAVGHILDAIEYLLHGPIGRLDRDLVVEYVEYSRKQCREVYESEGR